MMAYSVVLAQLRFWWPCMGGFWWGAAIRVETRRVSQQKRGQLPRQQHSWLGSATLYLDHLLEYDFLSDEHDYFNKYN